MQLKLFACLDERIIANAHIEPGLVTKRRLLGSLARFWGVYLRLVA
jgi:hypothetical protein